MLASRALHCSQKIMTPSAQYRLLCNQTLTLLSVLQVFFRSTQIQCIKSAFITPVENLCAAENALEASTTVHTFKCGHVAG